MNQFNEPWDCRNLAEQRGADREIKSVGMFHDDTVTHMNGHPLAHFGSREFAERACVCVNALAGVPTEDISGLPELFNATGWPRMQGEKICRLLASRSACRFVPQDVLEKYRDNEKFMDAICKAAMDFAADSPENSK